MIDLPTISPERVVLLWISAVLIITLPILIIFLVRKRLNVPWRYVGFGALIFAVFQLFTRVPAVTGLQVLLANWIAASTTNQLIWIVGLSLTAGLFEEVGRWVGYRFLMRNEPKTWAKAVVYGLGHGGFEAAIFVGGIAILQVFSLLYLVPAAFSTIPEAQRPAVIEQYQAIVDAPLPSLLLGVWERLNSMAFHVFLSVLVAQVFLRRSFRWLWLAIGLHTLANAILVIVPAFLLPKPWQVISTFLMLTLLGILSLWGIFAFRNTPLQEQGNPI